MDNELAERYRKSSSDYIVRIISEGKANSEVKIKVGSILFDLLHFIYDIEYKEFPEKNKKKLLTLISF